MIPTWCFPRPSGPPTILALAVLLLAADGAVAGDRPPGEELPPGPIALYDFPQGLGARVNDSSGHSPAIDLRLADRAAVRSLEGGGLAIEAPTLLVSDRPATRIVTDIRDSSALSVELWVQPPGVATPPGSLLAIARDPSAIDLAIDYADDNGAGRGRYEVRLRTAATLNDGLPPLSSPEVTARTAPTQVVFTYDALEGASRLFIDGVVEVERTAAGSLIVWDDTYHLTLANTAGGDRPWLGELHRVALFDRVLSPGEVVERFAAGPGTAPAPPADGLQSRYTFEAGAGTIVYDVSGVGQPLDLTIADSTAVRWLAGGGLAIDLPTTLTSGSMADELFTACTASGEITIEAWVRPAPQGGGGWIAALAESSESLSFLLSQGTEGAATADHFVGRLRTTETDYGGRPGISTPDGSAGPRLSHVVYTRHQSGDTTFYIDGEAAASANVGGDLSTWSPSLALRLANGADGLHPWIGELHELAIYSRALTAGEVDELFAGRPPEPIDDDDPPPIGAGDP